MGKYFGTDGFRGEANVDLTVEHAYQVGRFLGWYYGKDKKEKCKVVIGKDTRRSSYMFEYSLVAGLTASGADVYLLHVTTTPSVSYVVRTEDFDCGIMISASHNPYYDNGIKLINGNGEKMEQEVIDKVEEYLDGDFDDVPYATMDKIGRTIDYFAGRNRYMGYLMTLAKNSFRNVRVGLDCSNGSASAIAKSVFDAVKAKDPVAMEVAEQFGQYLGEGLAAIACVTNPEAFVIGGGVSKAGPVLIDYIRPYYQKAVFHADRDVKFELATLGNDAGIYGAAKLVLDR